MSDFAPLDAGVSAALRRAFAPPERTLADEFEELLAKLGRTKTPDFNRDRG